MQDIIFYNDSCKIDFKTTVEWYETKKLLKAYFPLDIRTDYATFEIGSGTIRRPIHENTSWDQARLEVCGHKFVDLSESIFGVSILNDCKYGFTVRDQTIGLSLLKAGEFPWENTDKMKHEFIYSIVCHDKPLVQSNVFEEAYKLNTPLFAAIIEKDDEN
jgi:alpha-mannosidase